MLIFAALILAAILAAAPALGGQITRSIVCHVEQILGNGGACASGGNQPGGGSGANPYEVKCIVSKSTNTANLEAKIVFVRVGDNVTLVKTTYSNGSSTYLLTHMGTAQAEAMLGGQLQIGGFGGTRELRAAIGGQLAGAKEWDFSNPQLAAAFEKQISNDGGWGTITHDLANNLLPPGASDAAGWLLNKVGLHDYSGLPGPHQTYVKGALVGGIKVGIDGGVGGASAALDAALTGAAGARVTTSGRDKGQTQAYIQLDGSGTASVLGQLFGTDQARLGGGAGGVGQVLVTVTVSPSGQPLNATITAWGGYTLGAAGQAKGQLSDVINKSTLKGHTGNGQGIQWSGSIDLTKHPDDIAHLLAGLSSPAGIPGLIGDFNRDGTQQVQPFSLNRSQTSAGIEGNVGVGAGLDGENIAMGQNFSPGQVKPPGLPWGGMVCTH